VSAIELSKAGAQDVGGAETATLARRIGLLLALATNVFVALSYQGRLDGSDTPMRNVIQALGWLSLALVLIPLAFWAPRLKVLVLVHTVITAAFWFALTLIFTFQDIDFRDVDSAVLAVLVAASTFTLLAGQPGKRRFQIGMALALVAVLLGALRIGGITLVPGPMVAGRLDTGDASLGTRYEIRLEPGFLRIHSSSIVYHHVGYVNAYGGGTLDIDCKAKEASATAASRHEAKVQEHLSRSGRQLSSPPPIKVVDGAYVGPTRFDEQGKRGPLSRFLFTYASGDVDCTLWGYAPNGVRQEMMAERFVKMARSFKLLPD
jgi:hypothetical protein